LIKAAKKKTLTKILLTKYDKKPAVGFSSISGVSSGRTSKLELQNISNDIIEELMPNGRTYGTNAQEQIIAVIASQYYI